MKYHEWVPTTLVELHKFRTEGDQSARKIKTDDPETVIARLEKDRGEEFTEDFAEEIRRKIYRQLTIYLPDEESTAFLELLNTDQSMKAVWVSLTTRTTPERDPLQFFYACERGITGWRGHQKHFFEGLKWGPTAGLHFYSNTPLTESHDGTPFCHHCYQRED